MPRLDPKVFDTSKLLANQLRKAAIAEFINHIVTFICRIAQGIPKALLPPGFAIQTTIQDRQAYRPWLPMPYLHLVIGCQLNPNMRRLIANHCDALIADILGALPCESTIRIDGTPADHWFPARAGHNGSLTTVHAEFHIAPDSMTRNQKKALINGLYTFLQEAFGTLAATSRIVIREISPDDCFPYRPENCREKPEPSRI